MLYAVVFIGVVLGFLLVPLLLMRTNFYAKHSNYLADPVIDFKGSLSGNASDVIVYGDSAALLNVVPSVVSKQTGLTLYNLGFMASVVAGAPDVMIDRYLKNNKFPKTIMLYIAPPTGVYNFDLDTHCYEAALVLERFASLWEVLRFYATNPQRVFGVAAVAFRNSLVPPQPNGAFYNAVTTELSRGNGWMPAPDKAFFRGARQGLLGLQVRHVDQKLVADAKYINEFKNKYERLGARVLVYVSPLPDCPGADISIDAVRAAYRALADNEPESFPCESFVAAFHMDQQAAIENSKRIASFLQKKLTQASSDARDDRGG